MTDITDLVARLRGECWQYDGYLPTAAALIESQAKEIERLKEERDDANRVAETYYHKNERLEVVAEAAEAEVVRLKEALEFMLEPQGHDLMANMLARKALRDLT